MRNNELKIIQDFYDFMLWMIRHTEKFPRHHRYSLGTAIENRLQKILGLLLKAKYRREKKAILNDVNIEISIKAIKRLEGIDCEKLWLWLKVSS